MLSFEGGKLATEAVTAYLGLGSNLGNRQANLDQALAFLGQRLRIKKISSIYDSEPVGNIEQPRYLNLVCEVTTNLPPMALLALGKGIENKLGRWGGPSGSPRTIDIDILLYGDEVMETPELTIPHPRMTKRAFVLVPLVEIAPGVVHPVTGKTAKELLKAAKEVQGVFKWEGV
ncbi:MAG: 2-amino-4-hydroxy-6-hydroxymethyldihydropteridine diphosphokinase [Dehalococcoidia bacterium]|nr:2-amino-4-hydroxy-6-hydroxymethyldihydropteridine diphosphokinase [Dehalococcoidia bacterium]